MLSLLGMLISMVVWCSGCSFSGVMLVSVVIVLVYVFVVLMIIGV